MYDSSKEFWGDKDPFPDTSVSCEENKRMCYRKDGLKQILIGRKNYVKTKGKRSKTAEDGRHDFHFQLSCSEVLSPSDHQKTCVFTCDGRCLPNRWQMFRAGMLSWQRIDRYDLCGVGQRLCAILSRIQAGEQPNYDIHWGEFHFLSFIIANIDWIVSCLSKLSLFFSVNEAILIDFYHQERKVSGEAESERFKKKKIKKKSWIEKSPIKEGSLVIHSFYSGRCPVLCYVVNDVTLSYDSEQTRHTPGPLEISYLNGMQPVF